MLHIYLKNFERNKQLKEYLEKTQIEIEKLRNSNSEVFSKKAVLTDFKKFKGKHLCLSLFFDKVFEKENPTQMFTCEF